MEEVKNPIKDSVDSVKDSVKETVEIIKERVEAVEAGVTSVEKSVEKSMEKVGSDVEKKSKFSSRTIIKLVFILIILFSIIYLGVKFYLWFNFILGNDILIKLSSDKQDINLIRGQTENVSFQIDILTNPFCTVECNSKFIDMTKGQIIEETNFTIKSISPKTKTYEINVDENGAGQKLFRFDVECKGKKTTLCNTDGRLTNRKILVSVEYDISEKDKILKDPSLALGRSLVSDLSNINSSLYYLNLNSLGLNDSSLIGIQNSLINLQTNLSVELSKLNNAKQLWSSQDYARFNSEIININQSTSILKGQVNKLNELIKNNSRRELIEQELRLSIEYDSLCKLSNNCINPFSIAIISSQENFNLETICNLTTNLASLYSTIETANAIELQKQNYPASLEFDANLDSVLKNIKQEITNNYLSNSGNGLNGEIIRSILRSESPLVEQNYSGYNLTAGLISKLTKTKPGCNLVFTKLENSNKPTNFSQINLIFEEPAPICCYKNNCSSCCEGGICSQNPSRYPIIMIHGHDFSKDVSSDYSVNIFNDLDSKLDSEGYLSAGIVSVSTPKGNKSGVLGMTNIPLVVKGSYYFDVLKSLDTQEIIQTKQENIDTYAIRLKEVIEIMKYRTGSPKVILVAHSMGGLISRRYIQVFGNQDVDKLILIAVPNHGIEGSVLNYCSFFGENIECKDMDKNSLVLNKLNYDYVPPVDTHNIIASGCLTDKLPSDGIVLTKNMLLANAKEYYINGSCAGTNVLHVDVLNLNKYPQTYDIIKSILRNESYG